MTPLPRGFIDPDQPDSTAAPPGPAADTPPAATPPIDIPRALLDAEPGAASFIDTGWRPARVSTASSAPGNGLWLAAGLTLLILGWVVLSFASLVITLIGQSYLLGGLALLVLIMGLMMLAWGAGREVRSFLRLRHVDDLRITLAREQDDLAHARSAAQRWLGEIRLASPQRAEAVLAVASAASVAEIRAVLRNRITPLLNAEAATIGQRAAVDGALMVALCPHPALDGVIAAFRSILVVRRVAELFGVRPGIAVTATLLRRVASTAASVSGVDMIAQTLADAALRDIPVLKHLASAIPGSGVAAFRLYRIAGVTAEACSPVDDR